SWAIPKGPSLQVGEKRLAVEVEDHPLDYGDFEGVIPEDAYGGGTVMLWDHGEWECTGKNTSEQIDFILHGEKLKGAWTLVRMGKKGQNGNRNDDDNNWLLIKRDDGKGQNSAAKTLEALGHDSAMSGRSMEEIAAEGEQPPSALPDPAVLDGARKRKLPKTVRPQLATLVSAAPQGDDWLHEFKFDGYRLLARIHDKRVELLTRNDKNWADRFPRLTAALEQLPVNEALLDGEAVAFDTNGVSDFQRLQEALSAGHTDHVVYQAFDLLQLNGYSLESAAQDERKRALSQLLAASGYGGDENDGPIRHTEHVQGRGRSFFKQACRLGLEGAICKRADSAYGNGRNKRWLKVKCLHADEFVVGGFTDPGGSRVGFGSLLIGAYDDAGNLVYSGRVGTGFSNRQLGELHDLLKKIERKSPPFADHVPDASSTHWVQPKVVIQVKYAQRTRDGRLRHSSFRGLREDKNANEVRLPHERRTPRHTTKATRGKTIQRRRSIIVAGVRLTHPQRVIYPEMNITKLDLARHYEAMQDWIVPALANRPLSLLRCLEGWDEKCFFQKHPGEALPDDIPRITITEKKGPRDYVYIRTIKDLVGLVQAGTLELHVWGSRIDDIERPDCLVFDLDPAPDVAWTETLRVARGFGDRLDELGLASFVRITGGKGLHLVVPLIRKVEWETAKAFAHALAQQYARTEPKRLTTNMSKDKRRGRDEFV
ncbi:MAG: DNA ligase D, partial [Luteimonas sp.]|nr:DNA ligase D [Luteimonas sp.]